MVGVSVSEPQSQWSIDVPALPPMAKKRQQRPASKEYDAEIPRFYLGFFSL